MLAVVIVIVLVAVAALGLLIFWLARRAQTEVPAATGAHAARHAQVVGVDEHGRQVTDADEPPAEPRDESAFERLLQDEIRERGMKQPAADDEA